MSKDYNFNLISKNRSILLGVATLLIMFFHSQTLYIENIFKNDFIRNLIIFFRNNCVIGVEIFLILSGVGLYYSFSKNKNIKNFYKKRALRILPMYFIVSIILIGFINVNSLSDFFSRIFFITFITKGNRFCWFIFLLIFLYILYPLLHNIIDKYKLKSVILMIFLVLLSNYLLMIFNIDLYNKIEIAIMRIPVFIIGIWFGKLSKENKKINKQWLGLYLLITILINICLSFSLSEFMVKVLMMFLSICIIIVLSEIFNYINFKRVKQYLIFFGKYSLEIYLLYEYLVKHCYQLFKHRDEFNLSYYIPVFVLCICLSILLKKISSTIVKELISKE